MKPARSDKQEVWLPQGSENMVEKGVGQILRVRMGGNMLITLMSSQLLWPPAQGQAKQISQYSSRQC